MKNSISNINLVLLLMLFFFTKSLQAQAEKSTEFSFEKNNICKNPARSIPVSILNKKYKTYYTMGVWKILDINGDGWCDWVRGGYEGYRTDQEEAPMDEFIYLGTQRGWRHFGLPKIYNNSLKKYAARIDSGYLGGSASATAFFQPIVIYAKSQSKPYIATVFRPDGPAPWPDQGDIKVLQWDDHFDKLKYVDEPIRLMVVEFLQRELCKKNPSITEDGFPLLVSQKNLCEVPLKRR